MKNIKRPWTFTYVAAGVFLLAQIVLWFISFGYPTGTSMVDLGLLATVFSVGSLFFAALGTVFLTIYMCREHMYWALVFIASIVLLFAEPVLVYMEPYHRLFEVLSQLTPWGAGFFFLCGIFLWCFHRRKKGSDEVDNFE